MRFRLANMCCRQCTFIANWEHWILRFQVWNMKYKKPFCFNINTINFRWKCSVLKPLATAHYRKNWWEEYWAYSFTCVKIRRIKREIIPQLAKIIFAMYVNAKNTDYLISHLVTEPFCSYMVRYPSILCAANSAAMNGR